LQKIGHEHVEICQLTSVGYNLMTTTPIEVMVYSQYS